jgi:DNA-directed RNA polymerase specialized sigma24 family protein
MSNDHSVSQWIADLKEGDSAAAQLLWDRFGERLAKAAQKALKKIPTCVADEEDVAASAFKSLCRGAVAGRLQCVRDRRELWLLLVTITRQKAVNHIRRETSQKRGGGRVKPESAVAGAAEDDKGFSLDRVIGDDPTPEFVVMLAEEYERLLALLNDSSKRRIVALRIEGYTVPEIAMELQKSVSTIERKLRDIRLIWSREVCA